MLSSLLFCLFIYFLSLNIIVNLHPSSSPGFVLAQSSPRDALVINDDNNDNADNNDNDDEPAPPAPFPVPPVLPARSLPIPTDLLARSLPLTISADDTFIHMMAQGISLSDAGYPIIRGLTEYLRYLHARQHAQALLHQGVSARIARMVGDRDTINRPLPNSPLARMPADAQKAFDDYNYELKEYWGAIICAVTQNTFRLWFEAEPADERPVLSGRLARQLAINLDRPFDRNPTLDTRVVILSESRVGRYLAGIPLHSLVER